MDSKFLIFVLTILIAFLIYKKIFKNFDFFEKRGISFEKPAPIFGNLLPILKKRENFAQAVERLYEKFKNEKWENHKNSK